MGVNLHHLQIFKTVADCQSITAAAEKLLISQPAVSAQLKQFEQAIGVPLLIRQPRGIEVTAAGGVLADYATRIFMLVDDALIGVRDLQQLKRGSLRIGASPVVGVYFLPPLLLSFQRRFPSIDLQVEIDESDQLEQRVRDGRIDLGLSPTAPVKPGLESTVFMEEKFIAVAAPAHLLAANRRVSVGMMAEHFIARRTPSASGSLALGYFMQQRTSVRPLLSLGSVEAVKQAVLAGLGATIISKMAIESELRDRRLVRLRLAGLPLRRSLHQFGREGPIPRTVTAFRCLLKHAVRGTLPKRGHSVA